MIAAWKQAFPLRPGSPPPSISCGCRPSRSAATYDTWWQAQTEAESYQYLRCGIQLWGTAGWVPTEEMMDYVTKTLESGPYLLGDRFSAADVLFGSTFALFLGNALLPRALLLEAYVTRCVERPAYQRAAAKDG